MRAWRCSTRRIARTLSQGVDDSELVRSGGDGRRTPSRRNPGRDEPGFEEAVIHVLRAPSSHGGRVQVSASQGVNAAAALRDLDALESLEVELPGEPLRSSELDEVVRHRVERATKSDKEAIDPAPPDEFAKEAGQSRVGYRVKNASVERYYTALGRCQANIVTRGFFVSWKPPGVKSESMSSRIEHSVRRLMRSTTTIIRPNEDVQVVPARVLPRLELSAHCEGLIFYGTGRDRRLGDMLAARFPLEYTVQVKLGVRTTNFETNGAVVEEKGFTHVSKEAFDRELQSCVNLQSSEVQADLRLDYRAWRSKKATKRLQELGTRNLNEDKLLFADSQKSNLYRFNWLLNDSPVGLEPQWGNWKLLAARLDDFNPPLATVHLTAIGETWRPMFHLLARKLVSRPFKPTFDGWIRLTNSNCKPLFLLTNFQNTAATMTRIIRTRIGPFGADEALSVSQVSDSGKIALGMETCYDAFSLEHGDPEKYYDTPEQTARLVFAKSSLYTARTRKRVQSKEQWKERRTQALMKTRGGPHEDKLKHMTREETLKTRDSKI